MNGATVLMSLPLICMGADDLRRYEGTCVMDVMGVEERDVPCLIEDRAAPREGYNNRWQIVLTSTNAHLETSLAVADYIRAENRSDGSLRISSILWGSVTIRPTQQWIRDSIASQAGEYEVRPQNLQVRKSTRKSRDGARTTDTVTVVISFWEWWGDLGRNGQGTEEWEERHRESIRRMGRAK